MMENELILHIREDHSICLEIQEDGQIYTKIIGIDTLQKCFQKSINVLDVETGLLPAYAVSVRKNPSSGSRYVVLEFPDEYADITYINTTYEHFPLPRLLFGFHVENSGRISQVKLGVPALGKLKEDMQMYCYPFSNVNEFSLCVGCNSMPHIKTIQNLANFQYHILSLPDNDDRYCESHNRLGLGHRDLLEHLRDKDRHYYYENILVPMPGKTLKDFL